jgi:branched-chain amino acid transport system ATP-binding protein
MTRGAMAATQEYFRVTGVSKSYGGLRAVDGVSFTLEPHVPTCLIGANGAGKSTLLGLLSGFIRPDSGDIVFRGERLRGHGAHDVVRLGVARSFQDLRLFGRLSVEENVLAAMRAARDQARLWRALVDWRSRRLPPPVLDSLVQLLEAVGLQDRVGRPAAELSYGEQKMLVLARVMATDADLLLLDEPLAGLANDLIGRTIDLARQLLAAGKTIVMVDHNMEGVMDFAERIIVLDHGTVIADGTPKEIAADSAVKRAYLGV